MSNDLRNLKRRLARRAANLLDPNWLPVGERDTRRFPIFYPGMSTAGYIDLFQRLNHTLPRTSWQFTHGRGAPAPTLDPLLPEVIEEVLP